MKKTPIAIAVLSASMALAAGGAFAAGYDSGSSGMSSGSVSSGLDKSFSDLDVNADGIVSADEASESSVLTENWTSADINQDGSIDESEFSAFESDYSAQGGTSGSTGGVMDDSTSGTTGDSMGSDQSLSSVPSFSELDVDADGMISRDEAMTAPSLDQGFSQADSNQDGSIDQSEFSAFESGLDDSMTSPETSPGAADTAPPSDGMSPDQGGSGGY